MKKIQLFLNNVPFSQTGKLFIYDYMYRSYVCLEMLVLQARGNLIDSQYLFQIMTMKANILELKY